MAECECLKGYPFFNDKMANMPSLSGMYKKQFCLSDNSLCARHMIFKNLGKEKVPPELFPNEIEKAKKFLEQK